MDSEAATSPRFFVLEEATNSPHDTLYDTVEPYNLTVPGYYVVWPCFGRAAVDLVLNRVRFRKPPTCTECRSTGIDAIHGFVLEPGTWAGEDIFRLRGMHGDIVVSERFKDFVERHGWTNMVLTPTEQFVWDPSKLGPAPLPTA